LTKATIILLFVILLPFQVLISNEDNHIDQNNPEKDSLIVEKEIYLPQEDFYYANNPRTLLNGNMPNLQTKIKPIPTAIIGASYIGIFFLQHYGQMNTIWKEQGDFNIREDGRYALYADKAGHFFGAYLTSYVFSETLMLAGFDWEDASITGSIMGLAYESYVEILDGFGVNWGFSPTDFYADVAGAGYFLAQYYVPYLQNITPKFIYVPAPWHGDLHRVPSEMFIDDYSSHTIFLSLNIHNMLPDGMKDYWPSWLELCFGYAARNLCAPYTGVCDPTKSEQVYDDVWGNPKFVIALDYNLYQLLPDDGYFWNWLKQSLNYFKLPSPAIEFGRNSTKFYLLYPFSIHIDDFRF
jgi:hypothetical protein